MRLSIMSKAIRGEIWTVNLDPTVGAEISKTRPAVVVNFPSIGRLPLAIVVPITDWKTAYENFVWFTFLSPTAENGLSKPSGADAFQIKSVSELRLMRKSGRVSAAELESISAAVALCVGYQPPRI